MVWDKSELNPFAYIVTNVVKRYFEVSPPSEGAPDAFRFAEPGTLAAALRDAGADSVKERVLSFHIEAPISPDGFWQLRSETSGTLREKLNMLSDEEKEQAAQEVQEAAPRVLSQHRDEVSRANDYRYWKQAKLNSPTTTIIANSNLIGRDRS